MKYKGFKFEVIVNTEAQRKYLSDLVKFNELNRAIHKECAMRSIDVRDIVSSDFKSDIRRARHESKFAPLSALVTSTMHPKLGLIKTTEPYRYESSKRDNYYIRSQSTRYLREKIRELLKRDRYNKLSRTNIGDGLFYGSPRYGWVRSEPNQILNKYLKKKLDRMFKDKKPLTNERHTSVEIEGYIIRGTRNKLAQSLWELVDYICIKDDGSLGKIEGYESMELIVCAPNSKFKEVLSKVCEVLNNDVHKARITQKAGLHVHLDMRDAFTNSFSYDKQKLADRYTKLVRAQGIMMNMVPKSRRDNNYCQRVKTATFDFSKGRYLAVNLQSIRKHQTLEVRLHSGTTDYTKIISWVELLWGIVDSDNTPQRSLTSVASFFRVYNKIPTRLMAYVIERTRKFASEESASNDASSEAAA